MQYHGLAWACALAALTVLALAGRILFARGWLLAWLRGSAGFALLGLAAVGAVVAYDLHDYRPLPEVGQPLLTLGLRAEGEGRYRVTLGEGAGERSLSLAGDHCQLDVRLFGWRGLAALLGLQPGYRLESLSGRYRQAEQPAAGASMHIVLAASPYGIDLWRWLREGRHDFRLFDVQGVRLGALPMVDGAVYALRMESGGLRAEAQNEIARQALGRE